MCMYVCVFASTVSTVHQAKTAPRSVGEERADQPRWHVEYVGGTWMARPKCDKRQLLSSLVMFLRYL